MAVKIKRLKCHRDIHSHFQFGDIGTSHIILKSMCFSDVSEKFNLYVAIDIIFDFDYVIQIGVMVYDLWNCIRKG